MTKERTETQILQEILDVLTDNGMSGSKTAVFIRKELGIEG